MDLERFVTAQDSAGSYRRAVAELRTGRKTSHWMWFIFPQISGLGRSAMAQAYAISDLAEAQAYLAHPVARPTAGRMRRDRRFTSGTQRRADLRRHRCDQAALFHDIVRARRSRSRGLQAGHRPVFRGTGPGDRASNLIHTHHLISIRPLMLPDACRAVSRNLAARPAAVLWDGAGGC